MIHIAICDDDRKYAEEIESMVKECCREADGLCHGEIYEGSAELMEEIGKGEYFDIFLLDIEMPGMGGMELAAKIRDILPQAIIIFITSYEKYVFQSFEVQPYRFIPKKRVADMLPNAIKDALDFAKEQEKEFYVVENQNVLEKIPVGNILYIWHHGKYAYIEKADGSNIKIRKTLKQIFKELPAGDFVWADRGCIVGSMQIERIEGKEIVLRNEKRIAVSPDRIADLKNQMLQYWIKGR